ncbi:putative RNase T2 family protein [Teratosphaeria destructans]|uniref:Ribonuclease T2-like n=1 Tax=Teratosphaeria destructans TaxID=418781 RepID=A0A9W7VY59_9PEZI|nr:putative RNase T2 family protein [Teratosphaeria destructans]
MLHARYLSDFALTTFCSAKAVLGGRDPFARRADTSALATCTNPQLSCHNTTVQTNLCCFNYPGGSLLQTQFWDTDPVTGPNDSWTIHGLWPDNCDGTYQSSCDESRAYTNITDILNAAGRSDLVDYMTTYWVSDSDSDESFWEHEWSKHGTCISTFDPDCYTNYQPTEEVPDFFNRTVALFKSLPTYQWLADAGIIPSSSATYSASAIQSALSKNRDGHEVYLGCSGSDALETIYYYFNVLGSVQTGTFEPADVVGDSSSCPSTGIKYVPKSSSSTTTAPTATSTGASATATATGFSGKGYLDVYTGGSQDGCIISAGTWYTTGTCASFTATASGDDFTLKSSKGECTVSNGALACGSSVKSASTFSADGNKLVYNGQDSFYADSVPSGSTQATVYTSSSGHQTSLTIQWEST